MKNLKNESFTSYRWIVLAVFMFVALISQLLWLTFAPISSEFSDEFDVNAFDVSLLSMVWPLVFVITAIPVGIFIDKKGFKKSVLVGATFMAVFSVIRIFSTFPEYNFSLLFLSQTGCSFSQPFIFGSITKLTVSWFPEEEHGIANGMGTIGLFLGMMLALIITPFLFLSFGIRGMLTIYAFITIVGTFLFIIFAKEGKKREKDITIFTLKDILNLSKLKDFLIIEYGFFAGVGGFTAIMTWLEEMLNSLHGISISYAGIAGGFMIIGGIIGSIIIPVISDKTGKIKPFVLLDMAVGSIMLYLLGITGDFLFILLICFVTGFFLMSALPLVLEISSKIAGKGMEGRASSMLWFFSQLGSIILIAIIEPMKIKFGSYYHSIALISILWAFAFLLFIGIKNSSNR
ncbi:MAG TPA: MFS transporter [Thermoplasmatales archaeon]|nr:MFS transporter [Thermoplasmatales archaeon]